MRSPPPWASPRRPARRHREHRGGPVGAASAPLLDNCEHVLSAAADLVDTILSGTTTVRVLATSREGLPLPAEHVWPVPPLDVRAESGAPAVELFLQRAQAVNPGFALDDPDEAAAVTDDLPAPRWHRPRHRAGRRAHGVDERGRRCATTWTTGSGCSRARRGARSTTRRSMPRCRGRTTCSRTTSGTCWIGAPCSRAASTWRPRCTSAPMHGWTGSPCSTCSTPSCGSRSSPQSQSRARPGTACSRRSDSSARRSSTAREPPTRCGTSTRPTSRPRRGPRGGGGTDRSSVRRSTGWSTSSPTFGPGFRWAADHDQLSLAVSIAAHTAVLTMVLQRFEPIGWAEELLPASHRCRPS